MSLPRFARLPPARRRQILDVATHRLAEDGIDSASYNQILSDAELPKASAYHYFDGRADLVRTVLLDVGAQLFEALGRWHPQPTPDEFRAAIGAGGARLSAHLLVHPDHRALAPTLVQMEAGLPGPRVWVGDVVDNGREIGMIRTDLPRDLVAAATLAVLQTIDSWAIAEITTGADPHSFDVSPAFSLVEGLWGSPPAPSTPTATPRLPRRKSH